MSQLESLYQKLPLWVQRCAVNAQGWRINRSRYGTTFHSLLASYEEHASWPQDQLLAHRDERLRDFVRHCAETVPYYRSQFKNLGISWRDINSLDDLANLPILAKATVQSRVDEFLSEAVRSRDRVLFHTSGTTGGGLRFATTKEAMAEQWAVWWRYRKALGISLGTLCGYFAGRTVIPLRRDSPPFWIYNRPARQIMFSGYHMSPETLDSYVRELRRQKPPWLHGYPSLIALVADHMLESGVGLDYDVRWITVGAENLLPQQTAKIERAFGVRPRQHYGLAEAVANISESPDGALHIDEDFAAVEFIPVAGGGAHRIVGTNLSNLATPLLRYDTQDIADVSGREVHHIDGRQEDYIILGNGSRIGRMDHIFKDMTAIREAQLYQRTPGEISVRVVRAEGFSAADEAQLLREFRSRVGEATTVHIDYVEALERSRSGKLRFVISEIEQARITATSNTEAS